MSEYNYDTDAQFFPFFVLTVSSLVTLPITYTLLRAPSGGLEGSQKPSSSITSSFRPDNGDIIDAERAKQKRKELRVKRMLIAASGWLLMAYMVYLMVVTARTVPKIWNPYDILEVSMSATEKAINSRYRRLSVTMHPDKRVPDAAKNETVEAINDQWVEIVKAYKALTDPEIRENYIQYGHPDGKQSTSFGIALPQILVADGSGKYVLIFYGALLAIGLPWLVGHWWYGAQKLTREKILVSSAGNLFKEYKDRLGAEDVVTAVSSAVEFKDIQNGAKAHQGLGKIEKKLQTTGTAVSVLPPRVKSVLEDMDDPVRRKTLALLWAYLNRVDLGDKALEAEKFELIPTAVQLNEAFGSMALAFGFTAPVLASYHLAQSLTQAVSPGPECLPLMQLPHLTPKIVREIENKSSSSRQHTSIASFMALPAEQRRTVAQAAGLSKDRLEVAESVARQLPSLHVEKAFFKVQGEKYIVPSSLVQFVVKARFIPPGTQNIPPVSEKELLDIDPAEGDLQAQKQEPEHHAVPLAHALFLPRDRAPAWHVFLADHRQGKVAVPPFTFRTFDKRAFDDAGKPTFAVVTLKMQFQAPPQVGEYKFYMHLVCDSYIGFDHVREVTLQIDDASKALEVDEDDISEPDEDSIAGQMAVLKGQPTADPDKPKRPRKVSQDEESDYESGTDEDEESDSETDTDTDTDDE